VNASELKEKRRQLSAEVRKLTREIELKEKNIITEFPKYYKLVNDTELKPHIYIYAQLNYYNNVDKVYFCTLCRAIGEKVDIYHYGNLSPSTIKEKYKEISLEEFTKAKNIIMSSNDDINSEKSKLNSVIIDITHKAKRELGML